MQILTWARGYKTFQMPNSAEHEILMDISIKDIKKLGIFQAQISLECYFSCPERLKCLQLLAFQH